MIKSLYSSYRFQSTVNVATYVWKQTLKYRNLQYKYDMKQVKIIRMSESFKTFICVSDLLLNLQTRRLLYVYNIQVLNIRARTTSWRFVCLSVFIMNHALY